MMTIVELCLVVMAVAALAVAYFAWQAAKSLRSIDWHVGAMASHSFKRLQMEAQHAGIEMIGWDKTVAPFPSNIKHNEPLKVERIYFGTEPGGRAVQPSWWARHILGARG